MTNLIPERRVDKNGVLSTKWVKPSQKAKAASIPSPVVSHSTRVGILKYLADDVANILSNGYELTEGERSSIATNLSERTDEQLHLIQQFFSAYGESDTWSGSKSHNLARAIALGDDERYIMDLVTYAETPKIMDFHIRDLGEQRKRDGVTDETPLGVPDPRIVGLLKTLSALQTELVRYKEPMPPNSPLEVIAGDNDSFSYVIKEPRMLKLILDHPDSNDIINIVIADRKTADYDLLHAAVEGRAKSLSSGIL